MESHIALLRDLKRTSDRWNASSVVIEDYNIALQRNLDLEVRISQLQKENQELVDENSKKETQLESLTAEVPSWTLFLTSVASSSKKPRTSSLSFAKNRKIKTLV